MFKLVYAKSVLKDLKKIAHYNLPKIKDGIEELKKFPNVSQIKHLTNHPIASYRLRIGNYRVLFDVDWEKKEIQILKIGHRRNIY
ncbi:MAG: type II toxin-antitoxin system RelE/ParE family toxin [Thermovirga sp.]|nr:type II toxin-antitoxin system RelE/ParE family toxin [Thermovirga sp.]